MKRHVKHKKAGKTSNKLWNRTVAAIALILVLAASLATFYYSPKAPGNSASLVVKLYKTPECGCCLSYVKYLSSEGYRVEVIDLSQSELAKLKHELRVPRYLWSCHTSLINDYVVEGHVSVEAIEKLLEEKPKVRGIAVPGMPPGAPGMPGETSRIVVYYYNDDGSRGIYHVYGQ
ncbi:MAG: hypothetical protein F7C07_03850 [Desulfurococcales archaeon]|nr:hypothetical protein [Desulfurococcales archaeon]